MAQEQATDDGTPRDVSDRPGEEAIARTPDRGDVLWVSVLALMAMLLGVVGVLNGSSMSALDEHTHLDYVLKLADGEVPYAGAELSDSTLDEWSCRGQPNLENLPACQAALADQTDPSDYPARGENYNYWHPPAYYAVTAVAAAAAEHLPLGITATTAARLTGALWLAAAVVAMFLVQRMWRVSPWLAASGAVVVMSVPSTAHAATTVTNDAPAALVGVAAVWILTRVFLQRKLGWFVPTLVAIVAASTKLMSTVALFAAVGVVALSAIPALRSKRYGEAARLVGIAVGPVLGVGAVAVAWSAFQAGRAETGWTNPVQGVNTGEFKGLPFDEWLPTLASAFGLVGDYYLQPALMSFAIVGVTKFLQLLMTASPFTNVATFGRGRPERMLGWTALLGAIAVPLLVQAQELLRGGEYFRHVSSRYAVSLVPMTVAGLVLVAQERRFQALPLVIAVVGYLAILVSFLGLL